MMPDDEISVLASLTTSELASAVSEHSFTDDELVIRFVKELDEKMASWDFTLAMAKYFKAEKKKYKAAMAEERRIKERTLKAVELARDKIVRY